MKKFLKTILALCAVGLAMSACSKDANDNGGSTEGENSTVSLTIVNGAVQTRGSDESEPASGAESNVDASKGLKVYIFNENGTLEYATAPGSTLTLSTVSAGVYKSAPLTIQAGNKYFFVFANDDAVTGKIPHPGTKTMKQFIAEVVNVTRDAGNKLDIATDNDFLLGTLWTERSYVEAGGTTESPKTVPLQIGRLVSKVNLDDIAYVNGNSSLLGAYSDGGYRVGTIAKKISAVGIHEGNLIPSGNNNVLVTSALHNAAVLSGGSDANFFRYSGDFIAPAQTLYVTENTTEPDTDGLQYFGNTSYIQIQTKYTPGNEVYDPTGDLSTPTTLPAGNNGTFWTVELNDGQRIIVSELPVAGTANAAIVLSTIKEYTEGLNYHTFPVYDKNETADVTRNRILRNHYYEFKVTKFNDLGSPDVDVDPGTPIPTKTTVEVQVTVKAWDKVSDSVEV